jgi:phosphoglucosamine mutase
MDGRKDEEWPIRSGSAFDGDGDRVVFASASGRLLDGDQIILALALYLRETGRLTGDAVVGTTMSSLSLEIALEKHGIRLEPTHVGDTHVAELMQRRQQTGKTLDDVYDGLQMFPSRTLEVPASERRPLESLLMVNEAIAAARHDLGPRGRIVVRYSQTEPIVRVTVEAEDAEKVHEHSAAIADAIEAAIGIPQAEPRVGESAS